MVSLGQVSFAYIGILRHLSWSLLFICVSECFIQEKSTKALSQDCLGAALEITAYSFISHGRNKEPSESVHFRPSQARPQRRRLQQILDREAYAACERATSQTWRRPIYAGRSQKENTLSHMSSVSKSPVANRKPFLVPYSSIPRPDCL